MLAAFNADFRLEVDEEERLGHDWALERGIYWIALTQKTGGKPIPTASTSRCTGATLTASGGSPETSGTATGPLPDRRPERTIGAATNRPARSNHAGKRQAPSPATGSRPGAGLSVGDSADSGTIEARRYPAGVNSGATTICDREVVLSVRR